MLWKHEPTGECFHSFFQFSKISTSVSVTQRNMESIYEKSDWSRAFNQFTVACELDMINAISAADRYCIYHVKFNVCLVTKPLGVFSETKWLNALLLFLWMNYVKNV